MRQDSTYDIGKFYSILPEANNNIIKYYNKFKKVPKNFNYRSDDNHFLTIKELKKLIDDENNKKK